MQFEHDQANLSVLGECSPMCNGSDNWVPVCEREYAFQCDYAATIKAPKLLLFIRIHMLIVCVCV